MKSAVIDAITAIRRCTPLLLPYLETSLRDTSPNSKEQAALALLRLVEKHGWSRLMTDAASMTPEEESRWSELIVVPSPALPSFPVAVRRGARALPPGKRPPPRRRTHLPRERARLARPLGRPGALLRR